MQVNKGHEHALNLQVSGHKQESHTDNERRLLAQYAVSSILLEAANLNEAAYRTLEAIGSTLDWELGAFWMVDHERSLLSCITTWHDASLSEDGFEAASRQIQFEPGTGLPGRVWQNEQPTWVSDVHFDSNFPRIAAADCEGLHSAFAFPIRSRNGILGIIEFFSHKDRSLDEYVVRTLITIGNQVGQFVEKQQAEEAVRASEARKTAILQTSLDAIITIDHEGNVLEFNPAAEKIFGYRREEILGQSMAELIIPPDLRQQHYTGLARYLATNTATIIGHRLEMHAMRSDGSEFPIELTITRISQEGPPVFTGYVRDITQRKLLEEALQLAAQEERARAGQLETIIEAISDAVLVYDASGQLTQANAAFREMAGIDERQDFVTQSVDERFSRLDVRDEHGYPLSQEQWAIARILQGEVLKGANTVDYTIHTPDGREIQVNASGASIRDAGGAILGGVAIIRDVTERRRLERRTEESLSALLDMAQALIQTPDEVAENRETRVSNPETINAVAQRLAELICSVLGCKRAAITAVEPETGEHRSIAVVGLSPEQERRWRSRDSGYHLSEQFGTPELMERLHAGEAVVFDMTQPPFRNRPNPFGIHTFLLVPMSVGSQQVGVLSLDYDRPDHTYTQEEIALAQAIGKLAGLVIERERLLSERAAAQANELALRETNRRMDEFLGMTSHELKTPLTSIKGNTQLALRQLRNALKKEGESLLFTRIGE